MKLYHSSMRFRLAETVSSGSNYSVESNFEGENRCALSYLKNRQNSLILAQTDHPYELLIN
jgi:hypothetical protein